MVRGAANAHVRSDLQARSDKEPGQKSLRPKGFAENDAATPLSLSRRPLADMFLPHDLSAGHFGQNSNGQSFLTGCKCA